MGWIKRKADEHFCRKPGWTSGITKGDIWECDSCKAQWIVSNIEFEDRPCGAIFITWRLNYHIDN